MHGIFWGRSSHSNIRISIYYDDPRIGLYAYVRKELARMRADKENYTVIGDGMTTVDGRRAYAITYLGAKVEDRVITSRKVYVEAPKNQLFILTASAEESEWDANVDIMDSSISTFHIKTDAP